MIKYCQIMDYNSIVQDLLEKQDNVLSMVECSWNEAFRVLALIEHPVWNETSEVLPKSGQLSPDEREFAILVLNGRAPILTKNDVDIVHVIPVNGSAFSCEIDMESEFGDTEIGVKLRPSLVEPPMLVKLASGNRSQNFIDEVFRAAQIANGTSAKTLSWLPFYENLVKTSSFPFQYPVGLVGGASIPLGLSALTDDFIRTSSEGEAEEDDVPGYERESLAKGMHSMKGRDHAIKCMLDRKQEQFIDLKGITVFIASWNVNGQSPGSICLREWLCRTPDPPDIYAIGFQELDLSKEAFLFNDTPKETEWKQSVRAALHPGAKYVQVKLVRLVGMMLLVYVKDHLKKELQVEAADVCGTGLLGKMGNKGGVAVRFELHETSICFVNCHLAAHVEDYQRRNQDYQQISSRMILYLPNGDMKFIKDHDQIFMFGDLNYRVNPSTMEAEKAKALIKKEKYSIIVEHDQLRNQMKLGNVFHGFTEGTLNFRPTYKYDTGTDNWDSSEKNRSPAWCDRILYKGENVVQRDYTSQSQYKLSDHKPISSCFDVKVKVINQARHRKCYEECLKQLDRLENEFLPQVTVDIPNPNVVPHSNRNEIHFGRIRFMESVRKSFTVANTGQVPVHLEFIKKLNESYVCKDWLQIIPTTSFISPGETCEIELTVYVDKKSASKLNIGKDTLYDILVLHLESGKDIFITIAGDYERSVFGCSIQALVNMSEPVKNISVGKLIELEKGKMPVNHYDVPKELWFLVDRLYKTGMDKENLFNLSGLQQEVLEIRDWLDNIPNTTMPGSIDSVAEVLLLLLDSFMEPVIPFSMHLRCIDSASNYTNCKQLVKQLPPSHKNVFLYICTFLRELLAHSAKNGLDPKILALLFGKVMLRDQNFNAKPTAKVERQKATFIYQFLVNEDMILLGEEL